MEIIYSGKYSKGLTKAENSAIETLVSDQITARRTNVPKLEMLSGGMVVSFSMKVKQDVCYVDVKDCREQNPGQRATKAKADTAGATKNATKAAKKPNYVGMKKDALVAELDKRKIDHTKATNNTLRIQLLKESDSK